MTSNCDNLELNLLNYLCIDRNNCVYTSCYCEENIWKLCEKISKCHTKHLINCFAVFISNDKTMVPLWKQRSGNKENDYLSVWDYHVILIYSPNGSNALVFDFDSQLSFPSDFDSYSKQTFKDENVIKKEYHRLFRVIPAQLYLNKLSSNRSRMRRPDGSWIKPPPEYDCIRTDECDNNLEDFISMDSNQFPIGIVMDLNQFNAKFSKSSDSQSEDQML